MSSSGNGSGRATPSGSPGLYIPTTRDGSSGEPSSAGTGTPIQSPFLHPLQIQHKVKETHKAQVEQDFITGRKLINSYEILDEIGRGVYGKVKLARNLDNNTTVAIKIVQRYSKKRRLGRISATPEDKTKREIAILKKLRHPHVVGLIEVIDDPELKKIYMILEHVELGEIVWRKKGTQQICQHERRRIEKELSGETPNVEDDERFFKMQESRRQRRELQRIKNLRTGHNEYWSLEHFGDEEEEQGTNLSRQTTRDSLTFPNLQEVSQFTFDNNGTSSRGASRATSRAPSRAVSRASSREPASLKTDYEMEHSAHVAGEAQARQRTESTASVQLSHSSRAEIDAYYLEALRAEHQSFRGRSPSMPDSIISHMSSVDDLGPHDALEEDYSYVPCLTMDQIRHTFREVVLGLEYLHYEGIVHRDIKPANLLWTKEHHVKISDFGVSYFGRPERTPTLNSEDSADADVDFDSEIELAKTVGTPAFFAPELCYTDVSRPTPKIGKEIDIWSLGVTLYCLVFARIPFLAEDELQLYRVIATQEVHIPKRRLKPVNPERSSLRGKSQDTVSCGGRYRMDEELVTEEVDEELRDLIKGLLTKDQSQRMTIRAIKRHPWVVRDLDNVLGWIDDTDPARTAPGRIEIDDADLDHAVVPLTFIERARSAIKKVMGKVSGRSESSSKRGTSSTIQSPIADGTPALFRESRRASLRGDLETHSEPITPMPELRSSFTGEHQHPLCQSETTSPDTNSSTKPFWHQEDLRVSDTGYSRSARPEMPDRTISTAASVMTVIYSGQVPDSIPSEEEESHDSMMQPLPMTFTDYQGAEFTICNYNRTAAVGGMPRRTRAKTLGHGVFHMTDKHSEPTLALSPAIAPGQVHEGLPFANMAKVHMNRGENTSAFTSSSQTMSTPNISDQFDGSQPCARPYTANGARVSQFPDHREWISTKESYAKAQSMLTRRKTQEYLEDRRQRAASLAKSNASPSIPSTSCPPSPDDEKIQRGTDRLPNRLEIDKTLSLIDGTVSSQAADIGVHNNAQLSHPSLPALVSGASSVSGDHEGDMLERAGTVEGGHMSDTDTLRRLSNTGPCFDTSDAVADSTIAYNGGSDHAIVDSDESDSDDGLTMGGSKRRPLPPLRKSIVRRDTNGSICSTDTAKKAALY